MSADNGIVAWILLLQVSCIYFRCSCNSTISFPPYSILKEDFCDCCEGLVVRLLKCLLHDKVRRQGVD